MQIKTFIIKISISVLFITGILLLASFTKKEIVWVAIGDSITYLNDHLNETGNRVSKGYLSRVVAELPDLHYINQGHNGWKSGDIASNIDRLGLVKADVYTVFLGTNDWWAGKPVGSIDDYKNNTGAGSAFGSFRIIIDKIRQLNQEARIILITPMQRNDFVYLFNAGNNAYGSYKTKNGQSLEAFANAVITIGKMENLPVIDLYHDPRLDVRHLIKFKRLKNPRTGNYKNYRYPKSTKIPFDPKNDEYPYPPAAINITYDGLHPSDKGNEIIAEKIINEFRHLGFAE
jgi:lysophospholipase L1-like esterase